MQINTINNYQTTYKYNKQPNFKGIKFKVNSASLEQILEQKGFTSRMSEQEIEKLRELLYSNVARLNESIKKLIIPNILHYDYNNQITESDIWPNGEDSELSFSLKNVEIDRANFYEVKERLKQLFYVEHMEENYAQNLINIIKNEINKKIGRTDLVKRLSEQERTLALNNNDVLTLGKTAEETFKNAVKIEIDKYIKECQEKGSYIQQSRIDELKEECKTAIHKLQYFISQLPKGTEFSLLKTEAYEDNGKQVPNSLSVYLTNIGVGVSQKIASVDYEDINAFYAIKSLSKKLDTSKIFLFKKEILQSMISDFDKYFMDNKEITDTINDQAARIINFQKENNLPDEFKWDKRKEIIDPSLKKKRIDDIDFQLKSKAKDLIEKINNNTISDAKIGDEISELMKMQAEGSIMVVPLVEQAIKAKKERIAKAQEKAKKMQAATVVNDILEFEERIRYTTLPRVRTDIIANESLDSESCKYRKKYAITTGGFIEKSVYEFFDNVQGNKNNIKAVLEKLEKIAYLLKDDTKITINMKPNKGTYCFDIITKHPDDSEEYILESCDGNFAALSDALTKDTEIASKINNRIGQNIIVNEILKSNSGITVEVTSNTISKTSENKNDELDLEKTEKIRNKYNIKTGAKYDARTFGVVMNKLKICWPKKQYEKLENDIRNLATMLDDEAKILGNIKEIAIVVDHPSLKEKENIVVDDKNFIDLVGGIYKLAEKINNLILFNKTPKNLQRTENKTENISQIESAATKRECLKIYPTVSSSRATHVQPSVTKVQRVKNDSYVDMSDVIELGIIIGGGVAVLSLFYGFFKGVNNFAQDFFSDKTEIVTKPTEDARMQQGDINYEEEMEPTREEMESMRQQAEQQMKQARQEMERMRQRAEQQIEQARQEMEELRKYFRF